MFINQKYIKKLYRQAILPHNLLMGLYVIAIILLIFFYESIKEQLTIREIVYSIMIYGLREFLIKLSKLTVAIENLNAKVHTVETNLEKELKLKSSELKYIGTLEHRLEIIEKLIKDNNTILHKKVND